MILQQGRPTIYTKMVGLRRGQAMKPWQLQQAAQHVDMGVVNFSSVDDVNRAIRRFERYSAAHPDMKDKKFPRHITERYHLALNVKQGMKDLAKRVKNTQEA